MRCAWNELISILPQRMRKDVDLLGRKTLQELRLRMDKPPLLVRSDGDIQLDTLVTRADLSYVINTASQYSPWAATTISNGYITAPGGHRIGICGEAIMKDGHCDGIRRCQSLCIRIARDFPDIAANASHITGNVLILGPPGSGKTTFLRDFIRQRSVNLNGAIAVVDEREEIYPAGIEIPGNVDVLFGCDKKTGIQMVLRTMGPRIIAVDEITAKEDCDALLEAVWCGVRVIATAHAYDVSDLRRCLVYRPIYDCAMFTQAIVMRRDKTWMTERIG